MGAYNELIAASSLIIVYLFENYMIFRTEDIICFKCMHAICWKIPISIQ